MGDWLLDMGERIEVRGDGILAMGYRRWAIGDGIWRRGKRRVTAFFVGKYRKYRRYLCMSFFFITFVAEWRREGLLVALAVLGALVRLGALGGLGTLEKKIK